MMKIVFVPITLDALVADCKIPIAKQGANFSEMPYQDSNFIDLQTDTANLASSIRYEPFNNVGSLKKGVHLHWTLPDALTQGKVQEASGSESLKMPTVPNRWLIIKKNNDNSIIEQWIVESDYLHPKGSSPERAVCIPIEPKKLIKGDPPFEPKKLIKGDPPFRYLGRQTKVTNLANWSEDTTVDRYENLNVLGWGNTYFSALYDQCFSVFGCYDSNSHSIASVQGCSYEVIGWYADSTKDYIKEFILKEVNKEGNTRNFSQLAKEIANWDLNNDLIIQHKVYKALKQTLADDFTDATAWEAVSFNEVEVNTDYKENDHTVVSDQGKLYQVIQDVMTTSANPVGTLLGSPSWQEVLSVEKDELYKVGDIIRTCDWGADQMLCYGRLTFDASASLDDGINAKDAQLALASTGTEAVSTYLSKQMKKEDGSKVSQDEQLRIENQLEAVILKDAAQGKNVDFINRLKADRHKQGFSQVDSGTLWAFIEESRIPITQQTLFEDTYDTTSKTLYIAGKKWVFTMVTAHENDFDNYTLNLEYSLNDGTSPVVRIENNTFIVQLGATNSLTTVGQLKATLKSNEAISQVKIIDNLDAEIVPNNYDAANKSLYIAGKKMVFTMAIGHEDDLNSHMPEITYALDDTNPVVLVNNDKTLSIQLGKASTPSSLNELKTAFEEGTNIEIVKIIGDEARYKNFTQAFKNFKHEQSDELQQLNQDQFRKNQLEFVIEHQREMLYSDWSKYMLCLYPVDRLNDTAYPDSDLIKHFIEYQTLPSLELLQSNKDQIAQSIDTQFLNMQTELRIVLTQYDTKASQDLNLVKKIPAPRFWEPNEPSLLISGNVAQPSDRHGEDGTLLCVGKILSSFTPNTMAASAASLPDNWKASATRIWQKQPWNPMMMEWNVALYPDHQSVRQNEDQLQPYNPNFIKESYRIPLNDAAYSLPSASTDMIPRSANFKTSNQPSIIKGNSLLTGGIRQVVIKELQAYLDEKSEEKGETIETYVQKEEIIAKKYADPIYTIHKAVEKLTTINCLSQQLDGLYDEYLMQSSGLRLPIEDPHRFIIKATEAAADTSFTAKVKDALGDGFFKLPATGNRFLPIRSGIAKLNQLRIVDTFGRYKDITCDELLRPQRQLFGSSWYLPPRLVQPARLNVRWHMLPHQQLQEQGFKGRTPVCGWLLYNYFDETLVIYNTMGRYVGAINSDGEWQNEDGTNFASTRNIVDPTLKKFVDKLRSFHPEYRESESKTNHLPQLKKAIRRGQENANPETNNSHQSTLRSQPLAIVRASLDLQLKGLPQANKSWKALNHDMNADGIDRSCREFTALKFPIKLGEYRNLDDGLICYWTQDNQGVLSPAGYFPQSDVQDIDGLIDAADFDPEEHDYIDAIKEEGIPNLHHCLEDPPLDLVILMDPEAPIHVTTGIVPKKALRLEPTMYQDALEAIDTSYFAAPLLTPRIPSHEHALPLPSGAWQWKQPHYGGHAIPKVSLDSTMQKFQLRLGIFDAPTKLKQLRTALEAMEEITNVTVEPDLEDDVLYPNTYSSTSKQLTLAGKQLTLIFGDGYQDVLYNHTPEINTLSGGTAVPTVAIENQTFSITLGDLGTPTTVGQLKEVLEEKAEITSVQTTHDASEQLIPDQFIPDQLSQEMKLYLSGKELLLEPKGDALQDYTLEVKYSEVGTLELPSVAVVDKQAFLTNEGNETEWETLCRLEILRSNPEKPNSAYYYPPSQAPDETKISDWPFIREALEKSKRPSLSPLNQIGPCEQRIEAVEGYFKKIKLPDDSVE